MYNHLEFNSNPSYLSSTLQSTDGIHLVVIALETSGSPGKLGSHFADEETEALELRLAQSYAGRKWCKEDKTRPPGLMFLRLDCAI